MSQDGKIPRVQRLVLIMVEDQPDGTVSVSWTPVPFPSWEGEEPHTPAMELSSLMYEFAKNHTTEG